MFPQLRVLALDDEFLIALDAQFALAGFHWISVEPRVSEPLSKLDLKAFDIILLDPESRYFTRRDAEYLALRHPTVFTAVDHLEVQDQPSFPAPRVIKPFLTIPLAHALAKALEPFQPNRARSVMAAVEGSGP